MIYVQNSILANGILNVFNHKLSFEIVTAFSGIAFTFLVATGFKALTLTAKIAVPLFFLVILYIFLSLILNDSSVIKNHSSATNLSISEAATVVAGRFIMASLTTPDISR